MGLICQAEGWPSRLPRMGRAYLLTGDGVVAQGVALGEPLLSSPTQPHERLCWTRRFGDFQSTSSN